MRGARPLLLLLGIGMSYSFERLIFSEVGDAQSQRVDRDEFVGYMRFENEDKVRSVKIALQLAMVGG